MFETDDYDSYRELLRWLALPRQPQPGDWYVNLWDDFRRFKVELVTTNAFGTVVLPIVQQAGGSFWAPRSDQWDAMLLEAGYGWVDVERIQELAYVARARVPRSQSRPRSDSIVRDVDGLVMAAGAGPTAEEAKARLWCYLTDWQDPRSAAGESR